MKKKIRGDLENRYDDHNLQMTLNTSTFLDPRFTFPRRYFCNHGGGQDGTAPSSWGRSASTDSPVDPEGAGATSKRNRRDLTSLLCSITSEKGRFWNEATFSHTCSHTNRSIKWWACWLQKDNRNQPCRGSPGLVESSWGTTAHPGALRGEVSLHYCFKLCIWTSRGFSSEEREDDPP